MVSARFCDNSGQFFLAFGLNMERYGASLGIESKYGKIWSRKTPNTNTFYDTARFKDDNLRKQSNSSKYFKVEWKSSLFAILLSVNTNLAFVEDLVKINDAKMKIKFFQTILVRIYWNFTDVLCKFDLSQLKPNLISSRKNFIYYMCRLSFLTIWDCRKTSELDGNIP